MEPEHTPLQRHNPPIVGVPAVRFSGVYILSAISIISEHRRYPRFHRPSHKQTLSLGAADALDQMFSANLVRELSANSLPRKMNSKRPGKMLVGRQTFPFFEMVPF